MFTEILMYINWVKKISWLKYVFYVCGLGHFILVNWATHSSCLESPDSIH